MALVWAGVTACGGGSSSGGGTTGAQAAAPSLQACSLFPANAVFNTRTDAWPVHPNSAAWVSAIGAAVPFHGDWGFNANPDSNPDADPYYGIPWNTVSALGNPSSWPLTTLAYDDESDCAIREANGSLRVQQDCSGAAATQARFPFPDRGVLIEGGNSERNDGDRHVLVVDTDACRLWETAYAYRQADGHWEAAGIASWNLRSNAIRPDTWTSADAAGLPILPLLVRAEEAAVGEIRHALRVTFRDPVLADRGHTWPATHAAGTSGGGIPFGALMRLKASVVIPPSWGVQARAIAVAMQRYGLYVADNGSDLFVQGEPSTQWDPQVLDQLKGLRMSDFEFVDTSAIRARAGFDGRSFAVPEAP